MTLEQSATWRGWLALILLGLAVFCLEMVSFHAMYAHLAPGVFLFGLPGLVLLRGWWKVKRRIRELEFQAAAFRKG